MPRFFHRSTASVDLSIRPTHFYVECFHPATPRIKHDIKVLGTCKIAHDNESCYGFFKSPIDNEWIVKSKSDVYAMARAFINRGGTLDEFMNSVTYMFDLDATNYTHMFMWVNEDQYLEFKRELAMIKKNWPII